MSLLTAHCTYIYLFNYTYVLTFSYTTAELLSLETVVGSVKRRLVTTSAHSCVPLP